MIKIYNAMESIGFGIFFGAIFMFVASLISPDVMLKTELDVLKMMYKEGVLLLMSLGLVVLGRLGSMDSIKMNINKLYLEDKKSEK